MWSNSSGDNPAASIQIVFQSTIMFTTRPSVLIWSSFQTTTSASLSRSASRQR